LDSQEFTTGESAVDRLMREAANITKATAKDTQG
jgi:hypothetical protein